MILFSLTEMSKLDIYMIFTWLIHSTSHANLWIRETQTNLAFHCYQYAKYISDEYIYCSQTRSSVVDYILISSNLFNSVKRFTVGDLDESDHFPISAVLNCMHHIDTESDNRTEHTRYIHNTVHFIDVLSSATNDDMLNNNLYDTLGNNTIYKADHIIVDLLQSATSNTLEKRKTKYYRPEKAKVRNAKW